jgi:hypothetical protein
MKRVSVIFLCFLFFCIQFSVLSYATEWNSIPEAGTYILEDGDVLNVEPYYMGMSRADIIIQVKGKVIVKQPLVPTYGYVTFEGITSNAELVYEGSPYNTAMISPGYGGSIITFKNLTVRGDSSSSAPVISSIEGSKLPVCVNIGENVCIDAGGADKWAVGSVTSEYNSKITIDKSATIIGTVSEGVIDNRPASGSTEATLAAGLFAFEESVQVGDTVSVTSSLNPSDEVSLDSASLSMSYDTDAFDVQELALSDLLKNRSDVQLKDNEGTITVSFVNTSDNPVVIGADGAELFTATFVAKEVSEAADFAVTGLEGALTDNTSDLAVDSDYPSVAVAVTAKAIEATVQSFGSDYKILMYGAEQAPAEGKAFFLNGQQMTYVPAYSAIEGFEGKQVYVLLTTEIPENLLPVEQEAASALNIDPASGDANMNGKTNIVDAQVAYYMLAGKVDSTTESLDWLNTDVNGDGQITALDYQAIQYYVHYGKFGQFN